MSPFVKQLMKELGRSEDVISEAWESAKKETAESFGVTEEEFTKREMEYTKELVRESLGERRQISIMDFLNSDKSSDEFITEAVQSSDSFGIDKSVNKKDPEDDEDDDKDKKTDVDESNKKTSKCPTCGNKYLQATGYCLTCKKKVKKEQKEKDPEDDEDDEDENSEDYKGKKKSKKDE